AALGELAHYWENDYDWRRAEAKLKALPQFTTQIDGVDIHFIHVKSSHEDALPLIMTHGWPGSVMELIDSVGPLTDPTAHGGSAERPDDDGHRREPRGGRADRRLPAVRKRLLRRDGHPSADDRLRPARLPRRAGRLDDRPRHGRLLQDRPGLRRWAALRQPH